MAKVRLRDEAGGDPFDVELQPEGTDGVAYRRPDGAGLVSIARTGADPGSLRGWLRVDGTVRRFRAVRHGDMIEVWLDGHRRRFVREARTARRSGASDAALVGGGIAAPMPGTILQLPVEVGTVVEANAPVVIMESMKMEMTLTAPVRARVDEITCSVGELVEMHAVLAKLTPVAGEADA